MGFRFPTPKYPETPAGKRSVRSNIYGNVVGYVGRSRFWEFGSASVSNKCDAELWVKGYSLEDIYNGKAMEAEGII